MTAAVLDEIDAVANDWRRTADRVHILAAIDRAAAEHDGLVHVSWFRPYLPAWIDEHQIGAMVCVLVRQRVLVGTGDYLPNGLHTSRNRSKPAEVRRLSQPIPPEALR